MNPLIKTRELALAWRARSMHHPPRSSRVNSSRVESRRVEREVYVLDSFSDRQRLQPKVTVTYRNGANLLKSKFQSVCGDMRPRVAVCLRVKIGACLPRYNFALGNRSVDW